jgi:hypothetical protein
LLPSSGYQLDGGSGHLDFALARDGSVQLAPEFAGFAAAAGNTLTIRGHRVSIDGTALDHDLLPVGLAGAGQFLPRATVHQLTVIPAAGYGFQPGSGIVADLQYGVARDGSVQLAPEVAGFAAAAGNTLVLRGYPIVIDATQADSDLVGIANLGLSPQSSRELSAVLLPARNYIPQTINGVFATGFNIGRDGTITLTPPRPAAMWWGYLRRIPRNSERR